MTFKVCNHGSKYPYLLHKMGFVDSQFGTTVGFWFSRKQIAIKKTSLGTTLGLTLCKYLLSLAKIPRGIIMELDHELGRGLLPREHQNVASDISVFLE